YTLAFSTNAPTLRSREVRQAVNWAVDRAELVRNAPKGHGVASSGPLASGYWALDRSAPRYGYDIERSTALLAVQTSARKSKEAVRFTCLVPPDAVTERVALELKRQLE